MQLTHELLADIALALDRPELKSYTLLENCGTSTRGRAHARVLVAKLFLAPDSPNGT
jgi:hypothetical protein